MVGPAPDGDEHGCDGEVGLAVVGALPVLGEGLRHVDDDARPLAALGGEVGDKLLPGRVAEASPAAVAVQELDHEADLLRGCDLAVPDDAGVAAIGGEVEAALDAGALVGFLDSGGRAPRAGELPAEVRAPRSGVAGGIEKQVLGHRRVGQQEEPHREQ